MFTKKDFEQFSFYELKCIAFDPEDCDWWSVRDEGYRRQDEVGKKIERMKKKLAKLEQEFAEAQKIILMARDAQAAYSKRLERAA